MTEPRRVLIDAVAATSGGGASRVSELVAHLPAYRPDHEFLFVAHGAVRDAIVRADRGCGVLSPPRAFAKVPPRLAWEHLVLPVVAERRFSPDVVLAPFNVAPLAGPPRTRVPVVAIVSNLAPYAPSVVGLYRGRELARLRLLKALTDRTIARAERVLLLSSQAFDLIGEGLLGGKAELLPMAPPPAPPATAQPGHDGSLLVVGDLLRYKGIETLVRALAAMPEADRPPVVIAGRPLDRPYVRDLTRLAGELGVAGSLRFAGQVAHPQVMELMRRCLACVVPSRFENPSRVPVEAMAMGAPVIASDIPEFRESCADAALYFGVDRPQALADHIRAIRAEPSLRTALAEAGPRRISALHAGSATERIVTLLDEASTPRR